MGSRPELAPPSPAFPLPSLLYTNPNPSPPLPPLRSLSLDVCEPVSAGVERALAQLTGLTALSLHFYPEIDAQRVMEEFEARWGGAGDEEAEPVEGEGGGPGQPAARPAPPPMPALDCALLEGMAGLQVPVLQRAWHVSP